MERIKTVDVFRLIAIIAVITIHLNPFQNPSANSNFWGDWNIFSVQLSRFAVPFFFIISGYFYEKKYYSSNVKLQLANSTAQKIFMLLLFWSVIYLFPFKPELYQQHGLLAPIKEVYWNIVRTYEEPLPVLFEGSKVHLWFLISLIYAIYLTTFLAKTPYLLVATAIALYFTGVLLGAYSITPFGIKSELNARYGPIFSLLPFVIGFSLSKLRITKSWLYLGLLIFSLATIFHFLECYFLKQYFNSPLDKDYGFSTVFMGVGVAMMALSNHHLLQNDTLSAIGKGIFGVYAGHFIFIDLLSYFDDRLTGPIWDLAKIFIVLTLSILLAKFLSKYKLTKNFV
ncbi:MAG: surface polysaccharide O-acyltransferase-like enzyme [Alteromonadaceae bacterium]